MPGRKKKVLQAPAITRPRPPLRVLGTSVTQTSALKRAATDDLGFAIEFLTHDGTNAQRQGALRPDSFDVYDQWFHDIDLVWPTGSLQPLEIARIVRWDELNDLPKKGRLHANVPRAMGADPSHRLFLQLDGSLGDTPSDHISMAPTVHNADSYAVIGSDPSRIASWGELLDDEWAGRVLLQRDAAIGCIEVLLAMQARGEIGAVDLGNLELVEIESFIERVRSLVQRGHFHTIWADEEDAISAMLRHERMIGSMWWSGFAKLRAAGVPISMITPSEGYRGWFGGLALSSRVSAWARDAAYEYINWWLDGRPGALMARSGAYMANPETVRRFLTADEWGFWYEGREAEGDIHDQEGHVIATIGERREGGDYVRRMSRVRVWNTVMNEHNYLVRKWNAALSERSRRIKMPVSEDIQEDRVLEKPKMP